MTVATGTVLPELVIDVTPTFVIAAAIATRDFQDVHHDRDLAVAHGGKDIFINILTSTGLVQRYVTDRAGGLECAVEVVGLCGLGDHVTGTVRVGLPGGAP